MKRPLIEDDEFEDEPEPRGVMRLEDVMVAGDGYSIRELEKLTDRTYTRVVAKLRELEDEGLAEHKKIRYITYWRLKPQAYIVGTVKQKAEGRPGRPSRWVVDGEDFLGPTHYVTPTATEEKLDEDPEATNDPDAPEE